MKFLIVGGFLGSGKTSMILSLAHHLIDELGHKKVVILENEIGEIGVDDQVLRGAGYKVEGMFSGCVCCTMAGELPGNVRRLEQDLAPDWIIMEATGMAFPLSIKESLRNILDLDARICCLADAQRWQKLVGPLGHLLPFQLKEADTILVNKVDLVDEDTLQGVCASIRSFNDSAALLPVSSKNGIENSVLDIILGEEG